MQILCLTDFTPDAASTSEVAAGLADASHGNMKLMHCISPELADAELPVITAFEEQSLIKLNLEADRLRKNGSVIVTELKRSSADRAVRGLDRKDTALIVMPSLAGEGYVEKLFSRSEVERVAGHAPVPTLVVRRPAPLLRWLQEKKPLRVLCGVDFTLSGDAAVAALKKHILGYGGPIEMEAAYFPERTAVSQKDTGVMPRSAEPGEVSDSNQQMQERDLWERLHDALGDLPVEVHVRPVDTNPAVEFLDLARQRNIDLVVVGTHQKPGISRLFSSSFSNAVLADAGMNVLCVPLSSYIQEFQVPSIRRVLAATDFSPAGNETVRHAFSLLPEGGSVQLLHVCGAPSAGVDPLLASRIYFNSCMDLEREKDEAEKQFEMLIPKQLATSNIIVSHESVVDSEIADAICRAADRFGADVICVGSRGHSAAAAAILGSVTHEILSIAHKPVMVITPPKL